LQVLGFTEACIYLLESGEVQGQKLLQTQKLILEQEMHPPVLPEEVRVSNFSVSQFTFSAFLSPGPFRVPEGYPSGFVRV
jgi:hypothetical protein